MVAEEVGGDDMEVVAVVVAMVEGVVGSRVPMPHLWVEIVVGNAFFGFPFIRLPLIPHRAALFGTHRRCEN
jgi:hypothetical protein